MCSRNGTRCTSRADVWPTLRGTSRLTCQPLYEVHVILLNVDFSSRLRCEMRSRSMTRRTSRADVWATRSGKASPTCLEQDKDNVTFLASWTLSLYLLRNAWQKCDAAHIANGMFVVNGAGSVAGVGRGARRALNALSSRVRKERQDWGASPNFKLCLHCFLCCGRAGGSERGPLTRSSWLT